MAPPNGWLGPLLVTTLRGDGQPPPCPAGVPPEQLLRQYELPGEPICDCQCGAPEDASCSLGSVGLGIGAATCDDSNVFGMAMPDCHSEGNFFSAIAYAGTPHSGSGGSCTPEPVEEIPPADVTQTLRLCGDGMGESCDDGVCVPDPAVGEYRRCIVRDGDFECPAPYSDARPAFADAEDDRDCTECECGEPTVLCTPSLEVHGDDDCGSLLAILSNGQCYDDDPVGSYIVVVEGDGGCVASNSEPTGSFMPTGRRSVCCIP
jgi:hypothetical protein